MHNCSSLLRFKIISYIPEVDSCDNVVPEHEREIAGKIEYLFFQLIVQQSELR